MVVVLFLAACQTVPTSGISRGEALFGTCVPCHGPDGGGIATLESPAIAGMEQWYVEGQLRNFQDNVRGDQPEDLAGLRMRPMARTLELEGDVEAVAEYIASLDAIAPVATGQGDATAGEAAYAVCSACHGVNGEGNSAMSAPALAGLDDWYIVAQLQKFKSGLRGTKPEDVPGATMRPMAKRLEDEAMEDIAAFIQTLSPKQPR